MTPDYSDHFDGPNHVSPHDNFVLSTSRGLSCNPAFVDHQISLCLRKRKTDGSMSGTLIGGESTASKPTNPQMALRPMERGVLVPIQAPRIHLLADTKTKSNTGKSDKPSSLDTYGINTCKDGGTK